MHAPNLASLPEITKEWFVVYNDVCHAVLNTLCMNISFILHSNCVKYILFYSHFKSVEVKHREVNFSFKDHQVLLGSWLQKWDYKMEYFSAILL